jgi:preprotein translocase subunit SecE
VRRRTRGWFGVCRPAFVDLRQRPRILELPKEAVRETKKVVWPTRKEATQITLIVFAFVLVMAIFLWGTDKILEFLLYDVILGWKQ